MVAAKLFTREEALETAVQFLHAQSWADDFDDKTARIIESNECINVLFRYKNPHKPPEILISIEKFGGKTEAVKLG